jgi:hypothetical protein
MDSWVFFINCKLKRIHGAHWIWDWLIWEPFSDWFLLVTFVVYAFIMNEQALKVRVSRIVAATSNDIWDPRTLTDLAAFNKVSSLKSNLYWTIENEQCDRLYHESFVLSPKLQTTWGKFLWVLKQIFDVSSNLLRSFVLLGCSLFMI